MPPTTAPPPPTPSLRLTSPADVPDNRQALTFHALGDPLRLRILDQLRQQELCVCDLCDRLDIAQSKLSFHLKTLKTAGLIRGRQAGRWTYYSLNSPQFALLAQYLAAFQSSPSLPAPACDSSPPP